MTRPAAAPDPLPVQLLNTITEGPDGRVVDDLEASRGAARWLRSVRAQLTAETGVTTWPAAVALERAAPGLRDLRDALRRLAGAVAADPRATDSALSMDEAAARVNALGQVWPLIAVEDGARPTRTYASGADASSMPVRLLAHQAILLLSGPQAASLKACQAPHCRHYWIRDGARREWCSAACGNRARVARHYRRQSSAGTRSQAGP